MKEKRQSKTKFPLQEIGPRPSWNRGDFVTQQYLSGVTLPASIATGRDHESTCRIDVKL